MNTTAPTPVPLRPHLGPHSFATKLEMIKEQIERCLHIYETEEELEFAAVGIADRLAILPPMITQMFDDIVPDLDTGIETIHTHGEG